MMTDKDLEKLMKKSSRKQLFKVTSLSAVMVMTILIGGLLLFNNHYNKWPFNKGKIEGVPDNTIQKLQGNNQYMNLLFPAEENLQFNTYGNKVTVYMERYEKSTLKETTELVTLSTDTAEKGHLPGRVQWGMIDWGVTEDNLKLALAVNQNEVTTSYTLKSKKDSISVNSGMSQSSEKLISNKPVLIGFWGAGTDTITTANYSEFGLVKEDLETNSESFALFLEVK